MGGWLAGFRRNRTLWITLGILVALFLLTLQSMEAEDWMITVLRGLAVGAVIFLAAAGLSLIFGLMDVLNLAHGTFFMLGAYVGWSAYVRPDTLVDLVTPLALLVAGFALMPVWQRWLRPLPAASLLARVWPWASLLAAGLILAYVLPRYPIGIWDADVYEQSPVVYSLAMDQGQVVTPPMATFTHIAPALALAGIMLAGVLAALSVARLSPATQPVPGAAGSSRPWRPVALAAGLLALGLGVLAFNDALTAWLFGLSTNWRFLLAIAVAVGTGMALGGLMEATLIRPLYARPMYQLMLTLGVGVIGVQGVIALWGRTQISMVRPAVFNGSGDACPADSLAAWLANQCSSIHWLGTRVRVYNEIFLVLVGLAVLLIVWLVIQRSRLGMVIRAGIQDPSMVEALGINVRRVFTLVFAVGTGLATLGGVLSGPFTGLTEAMGESLLLLALIALAIGGLTSFPGAAAGAVLVGLVQQFIIKYGQIGIRLPFLAEPFKPSPPLVPASTVVLMIVILLLLPQGLLGRRE
jgi:branched-chain amino acid transport system permease protein